MVTICRTVSWSFAGNRRFSFFSAEYIFSHENIKKTAAKFSSLKPVRMIAHQPAKRAAVLIPLCVIDDKVSLLYTLRAANLKLHRGQVSFPGGMQDVTDKSMEETALRETHEELGINESDVEIWGRGCEIVTRHETGVTPVIGRIKSHFRFGDLKVNPSEVEDVFAVPLEDLCDPERIKYTQFRSGFLSMPVFLGGKRKIWGLTALMTNRFLQSLLPQNAYSHGIKFIPSVKVVKNHN
ncbi:mitochondrial coenzyme A diphosphatase NUDT8 [Cylas formicarius]|uniref:mitochondrial coenzyme A diphosphatase NUDT8 n=1 Tax=Cylas formicarius TaxID=197179 RepID=UPI0029589248|nr:mitochondrial coenzyme A diphosphatase NUDT8 [Cylas formicarius]